MRLIRVLCVPRLRKVNPRMSRRVHVAFALFAIACLQVVLTGCAGMSGPQGTKQNLVQVNKSGDGSISSSPAGINCGQTCSGSFAAGTQLVFTATAGSGSLFSGWDGACTGTGGCRVMINSDFSISAAFTRGSVTVQVSPSSAAVKLGDAQQFAATVTGSTNKSVSWSVDGIRGGKSRIRRFSVGEHSTS
jgi:Divergent InlB B-repeat domain